MGLAQERVSRGQCPRCGKEAAPYYLCGDCRYLDTIRRCLKKGAGVGAFKKEMRGRHAYWSIGDASKKFDFQDVRDPNDGRRKPRLGGRRVDVDSILVDIIRQAGRPCTEQEIIEAWGRLRASRTTPLANDLGRIIVANDRRSRRNAKRAAILACKSEHEKT